MNIHYYCCSVINNVTYYYQFWSFTYIFVEIVIHFFILCNVMNAMNVTSDQMYVSLIKTNNKTINFSQFNTDNNKTLSLSTKLAYFYQINATLVSIRNFF